MKPTEIDNKAREIVQNRIQKGLLGPGSDTWGLPDEEEIISDYPLQRYFTGILFPEKTLCKTQDEADQAETTRETLTDEEADEQSFSIEGKDSTEENFQSQQVEENKISQNNFFPSNIGLSVCVPSNVNEIDVTFSFGLYYQPKREEVKIKIDEAGYHSFFDEKIPYQLPFRDILKYLDGYMYLQRPLKGGTSGRNRSEEYLMWDNFKGNSNLKKVTEEGGYYLAYYCKNYLEKLISRVWKRKHYNLEINIPVKSTERPVILKLGKEAYKGTKVGYNVKVVKQKNSNYVKIQMVNLSEKHPANRFSNKFETLNYKCLFQADIKVESEYIKEFKDSSISTYVNVPELVDEEAQELDFIYRNVKSYGVGHNCSVTWSNDRKTVETTFIPTQDIKDVTNISSDSSLDEALDIRNLSVWGLPKEKVISNLNQFAERYESWIKSQETDNSRNLGEQKKVGERLIERQEKNCGRLKRNIELLNEDKVFRAFQIANTAMFIQFVISNDKDFGKDEKELIEISQDVDFKSLKFFEEYDSNERLGFIIRYRPFQLAFFLLSIDGIIDPNSKSRKDIVDLIWFPTGGGKTEAYLAVTAFTIVFRRISNQTGYEGTTVIMRYTLRLLTAQQFERASRLISALEFLRNHKEFKDDLRAEPITIGLWVGQASTPNKIEDANKLLKELDDDCAKTDRKGNLSGDPVSKNVFQISSCPWCGTKLVSKSKAPSGKEVWKYGFEGKKGDFIIRCINVKCSFSERLPIQVVDEALYENPPTLLFGTVDKFAMLAWHEDGHMFFNSHTEALPPELIIQDELHLLSGPLGSITGIFESVIELLCTKDGRSPKIIASTATTRNTDDQVTKLYGNREVNIFPPSGITYDDSFFAIESKEESKRRYLGFMPTGKTSIDTQLQVLAHLLVARLEVFANRETKEQTDQYWTIVSYYNSLKDIGRIFNKLGDEVKTFTGILQNRLSNLFSGDIDKLNFNYNAIPSRSKELTSRVESNKIKAILKDIEEKFPEVMFLPEEQRPYFLEGVVDLVLATNMISVGIDIGRLNLMLLNGMPKNVAEYIQASSRIGRKTKGLVITLLDPNRAREKSYFEHFRSFHQAFYKSVEPLSITPFTENTIDKMLASILVTYVRNKITGMSGKNQAQYFQKEMIEPLKKFIRERFSDMPLELNYFERSIDDLAYNWVEKIQKVGIKRYDQLLKKPSEKDETTVAWVLMQSMREIDTNTYVQIKEAF